MEFAYKLIPWHPTTLPDGEPTYVMPLGDIQYTGNDEDIADDLLRDRIQKGLDLGAWFLGTGDYIDFASPSNREAVRAARLYDNAHNIIDNTATGLVDELYQKYLEPTKGRWLGLCEGHHFYERQCGTTTDQYLAQLLGAPFLGTCGIVGLAFVNDKDPKLQYGTVNIWVHHGQGSGVSAAAPVTKLEKAAKSWDCQIFVMGHMTKMATAPMNVLHVDWRSGLPKLRDYSKILVGAGGFAKSYKAGATQGAVPRGDYVEKGMMTPATLGNPVITIRPRIMDMDQRQRRGNRSIRHRWFRASVYGEVGG